MLRLAGVCTLLLSSAALIYLLVRQSQLTEELLRLEAQVTVLAQGCGLQDRTSLQKLQRSRRNQEEAEREDEKDTLMLTTLVPVRPPSTGGRFLSTAARALG